VAGGLTMMLRGLILGMVVCHIVSAQQPVHAEVDDLHDLQFESSTPEDPEPVNLKERLRTPEPPLRPSPRVRSAASPQLDRQHPQDPPAAQAFATAAADGEDDASGSAIFGHPVSVNMASLGHLAGECAVGLSIGAAAAWTLRRLQGMVMLLGTLSTVGTIAALHLKWVSPEQIRIVALAIARMAQAKALQLARVADADGDGELSVEDSRVIYSRVAPLVRRHTALTGGLVGGFITAYSALR